jgi:hypothetical protein
VGVEVFKVDGRRVEDLVGAGGDARVDVDDEDFFAERLLPDGVVCCVDLARGVAVDGVRGIVFYGFEEGGEFVAEAGPGLSRDGLEVGCMGKWDEYDLLDAGHRYGMGESLSYTATSSSRNRKKVNGNSTRKTASPT